MGRQGGVWGGGGVEGGWEQRGGNEEGGREDRVELVEKQRLDSVLGLHLI